MKKVAGLDLIKILSAGKAKGCNSKVDNLT